MEKDLLQKIEKITVLIMDVDGVMTDGKIIIDDLGNETKHFNARDGQGMKLLMRAGIEVFFLTGRKSQVVEHRAAELGVRDVYQGSKNKGEKLDSILNEKGLSGDAVAYMGDDVVDIPVFRKVGFSVAVADACEEAIQIADYVTEKRGGDGAVREVC
ncbi:MAG: HAD-IIIA family hydrolase, partial [Deltaproteobacteria bacterium]|nr:HAD-IIIA family hydrolase [Deltaproteobacteria bacterium]